LNLHDSGCAKTIINKKVFDKLLEKGHIEVYQPERPTVIVTASGEAQQITGTADILLHFEGLHGIQKSFELNVIVHAGITQDFLLGRDFTGSDARAVIPKVCSADHWWSARLAKVVRKWLYSSIFCARAFETNKFLFLTDDPDGYLDSIGNAIKNGDLCQVPILGSKPAPLHVAANNVTIIPPFENGRIIGTLAKDPNRQYQLPLSTNSHLTSLNNARCLVCNAYPG
jgi:hypothetical protein